MENYKGHQSCTSLIVEKCNKVIWTYRMNSGDRNTKLKVKIVEVRVRFCHM